MPKNRPRVKLAAGAQTPEDSDKDVHRLCCCAQNQQNSICRINRIDESRYVQIAGKTNKS